MAFLKIVQGKRRGQVFELRGERTVIGRHPSCQIVLDGPAISRQHAQIFETYGRYFLEDMRSRNRTRLNGESVDGRTELADGDTIKICDILFEFSRKQPSLVDLIGPESPPASETRAGVRSQRGNTSTTAPEVYPPIALSRAMWDVPDEDDSAIITTINTRSTAEPGAGVRADVKLRAVLEIGRALGNVIELDEVLARTLDGLFRMFPQADEGFVLLEHPETNDLTLRSTRSRHGTEAKVRISKTVVKKAMETGAAILSADAVGDQRFKASESVSELQIRSMLCVPLLDPSGETLGVIQLDTFDVRRRFAEEDLELLASVASQVSLAVLNARLHEKLLAQREMDRDLDFATQIQLGFLPNKRPKVDGYEFFDYYEAALRVGGDSFDYVALADGRLVVGLGDVAGKGIPAALLMARLQSTARLYILTQPTLGKAFDALNREITSSGLGFRFITYVAALLDPRTHEVTIANAGHLPPLLRRHSGQVEFVAKKDSGMPFGVAMQEKYAEAKITLEPGDLLVVYSDGVTEAMNAAHEFYTRQRLATFLEKQGGSTEATVNAIINDVELFCQDQPQRDDTCLVCIKRLKPKGSK